MTGFVIESIGGVAAVLTTLAFLPQVIKTWKSKDAKSLSMPMLLMTFLGICLWAFYGVLKGSLPLIVANSITAINAGILIFFKLKYK